MTKDDLNGQEAMVLARMLGHRYGNGQVYLQSRAEQSVFHKAIRMGLIDEEGYLTGQGYRFWGRWDDQS